MKHTTNDHNLQIDVRAIEDVRLELLTDHPQVLGIYDPDTEECLNELAEMIKKEGVVGNLPIIDYEFRVVCGLRVVAAARIAGLTSLKVEKRDITPEQAAAIRVLSNQHRKKTFHDIYREAKILKAHWSHQGRKLSSESPEENLHTRERISKATGVSGSTLHRIEKIGNVNENLLVLAESENVSLQALAKDVDPEKPDHELSKPHVEVDLTELPCCRSCGGEPARLVYTRDKQLRFRHEVNEEDILF